MITPRTAIVTTAVSMATIFSLAGVAGAVTDHQPTLADIPAGCSPAFSLMLGERTVTMADGCAPIVATLVADNHTTGKITGRRIMLAPGSKFTVLVPACTEEQGDVFIGEWTDEELEALGDTSAQPWLMTAALFIPDDGRPVPAEWAPFLNAVHRVPADNCSTTTIIDVPTPTTAPAPRVEPEPEITVVTVVDPAPTTTTTPYVGLARGLAELPQTGKGLTAGVIGLTLVVFGGAATLWARLLRRESGRR